MACPICKEKKVLYSIKVKDYEYNLKNSAQYNLCRSCQSIYRHYPKKIKKTSQKKYYKEDSYLPLKGGIIYDFLKDIYSNYEIKKIKNILNLSQVNKVLDLACGKGYLIKNIAKRNSYVQCFGIDAHIKTKLESNVSFIKSSFDNFQFIKRIKPSLIIINNFIEHIEDIKKINKLISLMKKGTFLIIITPDCNSSGRRIFQTFWSGYHAPRHKNIFNKNSLKTLISRNKNVKYSLEKIYDPFSNFLSIKNYMKQISMKNIFSNLSKVIFLSFFVFTDLFKKNRILVKLEKL